MVDPEEEKEEMQARWNAMRERFARSDDPDPVDYDLDDVHDERDFQWTLRADDTHEEPEFDFE